MGPLPAYTTIFLAVAVVAAVFGFGRVPGVPAEGARVFFWIAVILFLISFVAELMHRHTPNNKRTHS
jgi:uncharacterized membrane protein YtjA (UPF0391 family)